MAAINSYEDYLIESFKTVFVELTSSENISFSKMKTFNDYKEAQSHILIFGDTITVAVCLGFEIGEIRTMLNSLSMGEFSSTKEIYGFMREYINMTAGSIKKDIYPDDDISIISLPLCSKHLESIKFFKYEKSIFEHSFALKTDDMTIMCNVVTKAKIPSFDLKSEGSKATVSIPFS